MKKQIFAMMLSAAVLCGTAAAGWTAEADLSPDIDVVIDGTERTFYNASGTEVHPISYQDTTYLPVRAIGELMGKNVNWDAATQTISIGGTRVTGTTSGTADRNARAQDISLTVRGSARQVKKLYSIRINIALDSGFPYNRKEEPGEGKWTCKEGDRYVHAT